MSEWTGWANAPGGVDAEKIQARAAVELIRKLLRAGFIFDDEIDVTDDEHELLELLSSTLKHPAYDEDGRR